MKKLILGSVFVCLISSELFAMKAILVCRTNGISYKTMDTIGIDCGNSSSFECQRKLENAIINKYGGIDAYYAESRACHKIINGGWYPHKIKIEY